MNDGQVFLILLLIGIAISGWLGFCIGEERGWNECVRVYKRLIDESSAEQAAKQADDEEIA